MMSENEGHPSSTIIKEENINPNSTVVFVGNGAIEGGWPPLRAALDSWILSDHTVHPTVTNLRRQDREAFHQLALQSYKFKVARGMYFAGWHKFKKGEANQESIQITYQKGLSRLITNFLALRNNISQSYQSAQAKTSLRIDDEIKSLIGENAHFVTTNWDNTLWKSNDVKNLIHLHGRCEYADSIVFPTELIIEDTAYDFSIFTKQELSYFNQPFIQSVVSTYRSNFIEALLTAHSKTTQWLKGAKRIVIWGYSLGDYDADVNALVGTYTSSNVDDLELIVIDVDPLVFQRAIALTGVTNAVHYNPRTKTKIKLVI